MPILDGSIDRLIRDERVRMQEFLKGETRKDIDENGLDKKIIKELDK